MARGAAGRPPTRSSATGGLASACLAAPAIGYFGDMATLLWILAVVLVVAGILALFRRQVLWGVVLIIVGLLVGPGGVSIFT